MCTLSFVAKARGFLLGMNRDEKLARVAGLPPEIKLLAGRKVIRPTEPGDGTWIGRRNSSEIALVEDQSIPINWSISNERTSF